MPGINEQPLAHKYKMSKPRSTIEKGQKVPKNVLFGQKVGQILTYPIAQTESWLEICFDFLQFILIQFSAYYIISQ
jgi:hypothetical protein